MPDNLASYKVFSQGGLNLNRDVLSQGETQPGSAIALINYEPSITGGYRRVSGFSNDYGTVPGTGSVLGVAVANDINDGILAARAPSSGNDYLHYWDNATEAWVAITTDVVANDRDGVATAQTPSGAGNLTIDGTLADSGSVNFTTSAAEQPRLVTFYAAADESGVEFTITGTDDLGLAQTETVTGPNATTVSSTKYFNTITQIAVDGATTGDVEVGSGTGLYRTSTPTMTGVTKVRFVYYELNGVKKVIISDGVNPTATYDGTNYKQITDSAAPSAPKLSTIYNSRSFLAGDPSEPYNLYVSSISDELSYSGDDADVFNVGFDIVALKVFREALYVFGITNIKKFTGFVKEDFTLSHVTDDLGCLATDSVIEIGGDLLFLSQDGIRPIGGTDKIGDVNLETITKNIQSLFTDVVLEQDLDALSSVIIRSKSQFRLFYDIDNANGLVGGLRLGQQGNIGFEFGQLLGIEATCADSGYIGQYEFVIHGDKFGNVHRQEQGNNFGGANIVSIYQTPFLHMQDPEQRKIIHSVATYLRSEGNNEIIMSVIYDYDDITILNPSNFILTNEGAAAYYNEAIYDEPSNTTIWSGNPSPVQRVNVSGSGKSVSFRYVTNDTNSSHSVQGIVVTFGVGDRL